MLGGYGITLLFQKHVCELQNRIELVFIILGPLDFFRGDNRIDPFWVVLSKHQRWFTTKTASIMSVHAFENVFLGIWVLLASQSTTKIKFARVSSSASTKRDFRIKCSDTNGFGAVFSVFNVNNSIMLNGTGFMRYKKDK